MSNRVIAAVSRNGIIGVNNDLCWRLADDLFLFKRLTVGRVVLMGRKTFASLGYKPLPDRENVVMTKFDLGMPGVRVVKNEIEMIDLLQGRNVDVIGGGEIYKMALKSGLIDECVITHVDASVGSVNGSSTSFPLHLMSDFVPANTLHNQEKNARNEHPFITVKYVRG